MGTLTDWTFYEAQSGTLKRADVGKAVQSGVSSLWSREKTSEGWDLQVMLEERSGSDWCFRRDPLIRRPQQAITWSSPNGISVLRPEIQLLYKAKDVRPKDQRDFDSVVPTLHAETRDWLARTLALVHPHHAWTRTLAT